MNLLDPPLDSQGVRVNMDRIISLWHRALSLLRYHLQAAERREAENAGEMTYDTSENVAHATVYVFCSLLIAWHYVLASNLAFHLAVCLDAHLVTSSL